jgi:hypothetical protein
MDIHIPASVEVISEMCFERCNWLGSVTFEENCKASQLEKKAFFETALTEIHIPRYSEIMDGTCCAKCHLFKSMILDQHCKLVRIKRAAFHEIALCNRLGSQCMLLSN